MCYWWCMASDNRPPTPPNERPLVVRFYGQQAKDIRRHGTSAGLNGMNAARSLVGQALRANRKDGT